MKLYRGAKSLLPLAVVAGCIFVFFWVDQFSGPPVEPDREMTWRFVERTLKLHDEYLEAPAWQKMLTGYWSAEEIQRDIFAAIRYAESAFEEEDRLILGRVYADLGDRDEALDIFEAVGSDLGTVWANALREDPPVLPRFTANDPSVLDQVLALSAAYLLVGIVAAGICLLGFKKLFLRSRYWTWTWAGRWSSGNFWMLFLQMEALAFLAGIGIYFVWVLFPPEFYTIGAWTSDTALRLVLACGMAWLLIPRVRPLTRSLGLLWENGTILLWTAAGIVLCGVSDFFIGQGSRFVDELDVSDFLTADLLDVAWPSLVVQLFLFSVLAPLVEELLFRGLIYPTLRRKIGIAAAMIATSLVFAVVHFYSPLGFVDVFIAGLLFTVLYERSGSLYPSIFVHGIYNLWATVSTWVVYQAP